MFKEEHLRTAGRQIIWGHQHCVCKKKRITQYHLGGIDSVALICTITELSDTDYPDYPVERLSKSHPNSFVNGQFDVTEGITCHLTQYDVMHIYNYSM